MSLSKTATLDDAKVWLRDRAREGEICPCCEQYVKVYKRALNAQMARWLIWLVRCYRQSVLASDGNDSIKQWVDIKGSPVRGGDYAKLVHWALVEHKRNEKDATRKDSGLWRPTQRGVDFVFRRCSVPSHVYLYDNRRLNWDDNTIRQVTVVDCLDKKFNYEELMKAPIPQVAPL